MARKTFKIGESCTGGILQVEVNNRNHTVRIRAKDWSTKVDVSADAFTISDKSAIDEYLNELTSSYHASKVLDWIKSQVV